MSKHVYLDREGELWLDPGNGELICLDDYFCRRLQAAWPQVPKDVVVKDYGPLQVMQPKGLD